MNPQRSTYGDTDAIDDKMRMTAFEQVQRLYDLHESLTTNDLKAGFNYEGNRIPLVNPQRGIFKPKKMRYLLSIRTVFPAPGKKVWYDDQREIHRRIIESEDTLDYAFMGQDPNAADNQWLLEAFKNQVPVIYFLGIAPGRYQAIIPAFIYGWDPNALIAQVVFGVPNQDKILIPQSIRERRYALRVVKQRLHQSTFREAVIAAYNGRCAVSGLPERRLLDAAHIISDKNELMGQPVITNGLPLSKIHHSAFDSNLIGINPDYRLHVSERLLSQNDGPMLESFKQLNGNKLRLPTRLIDYPDRERLAVRFEEFKASGL